jgi:hypothetical protein
MPPAVQHNIAALVTDFAPLRVPLGWVADVAAKVDGACYPAPWYALSLDVECYTNQWCLSVAALGIPLWQVDAHNIVPCWVASDKLEYGARTIRGKIHKVCPAHVVLFGSDSHRGAHMSMLCSAAPPRVPYRLPRPQAPPFPAKSGMPCRYWPGVGLQSCMGTRDADGCLAGAQKAEAIDWAAAMAGLEIDRTVKEVRPLSEPGRSLGPRFEWKTWHGCCLMSLAPVVRRWSGPSREWLRGGGCFTSSAPSA